MVPAAKNGVSKGETFIMGWTRWGEVIIRIMPQPRQRRLLHGGDSVTETTADF